MAPGNRCLFLCEKIEVFQRSGPGRVMVLYGSLGNGV